MFIHCLVSRVIQQEMMENTLFVDCLVSSLLVKLANSNLLGTLENTDQDW